MQSSETSSADARKFAFFDLDHTIIPHDTQLLFCNFVLRHEPWRRLFQIPFFCIIPLAVLKLLRARTMKRVFLGYLWGMKKARLAELAEKFAREEFGQHAYPEIVEVIQKLKAEGRLMVLNTASPQIYGEPIAKVLGFDRCYATQVEIPERMKLLAEVLGPNNKRGAKIDAMADILPPGITGENREVIPGAVSFTDSVHDTPLLDLAETGFVVNPSAGFEKIRAHRGWQLLTPTTPYHGEWGNRWAMVRQLLGVFPVKSK